MFGLVLMFVHWGSVCVFLHYIIIEHIPECLVWWDSVSYVSYYPTLGHTPILEFIGYFADSLTTRSTSWSLWVVTLGHTPHPWVHQVFCVLSHCSIYFLIFVSRHTRAYPFSAWPGAYPLSLGLSCLVLISWLSDAFCRSLRVIPLPSVCLGHPPIVTLFRASPYCHLI